MNRVKAQASFRIRVRGSREAQREVRRKVDIERDVRLKGPREMHEAGSIKDCRRQPRKPDRSGDPAPEVPPGTDDGVEEHALTRRGFML
jgi:hypothetical protein